MFNKLNKNAIKETAGVLFTLLLVLIYINGCIHSYRHHDEDDHWLDRYGANALFRGVEAVWHKFK